MTRSKKLILPLLSVIICAALVCAVLLFCADNSYARAAEQSAHDYEHTIALSEDTTVTDGGKYYLSGNLNRNIEIPTEATVELCLNGHTLTGTGTGYVITVKDGATLKLHDCSGNNSGTIIGGNGEDGGGVKAEGSGSFIMTGGTILANNSLGNGVYISGSTSSMSSGVITGYNTGVYIQGGSFTMTGGTISQNTIGVYANQTLHLSGTPKITDNTSENAHIRKPIEMSGKLEEGARIGVTLAEAQVTITAKYAENNQEHPSEFFFSDNESYNIILNNGEAEISTTVEVAGIVAVFNQGDAVVYPTTELNSLKSYLEVKIVNNDGSYANGGTPLNDGDYILFGELAVGESVITVTYGNYQTTFTVTVSIESPSEPPVDDPGDNPSAQPNGGGKSSLIWLPIILSVVLLADGGILVIQLIRRKQGQAGKESEGGNK